MDRRKFLSSSAAAAVIAATAPTLSASELKRRATLTTEDFLHIFGFQPLQDPTKPGMVFELGASFVKPPHPEMESASVFSSCRLEFQHFTADPNSISMMDPIEYLLKEAQILPVSKDALNGLSGHLEVLALFSIVEYASNEIVKKTRRNLANWLIHHTDISFDSIAHNYKSIPLDDSRLKGQVILGYSSPLGQCDKSSICIEGTQYKGKFTRHPHFANKMRRIEFMV